MARRPPRKSEQHDSCHPEPPNPERSDEGRGAKDLRLFLTDRPVPHPFHRSRQRTGKRVGNHKPQPAAASLAFVLLWLSASAILPAQTAPIPSANELPGQPFAIKKTWVIGGAGNWDYLTLDPSARQLFIAHQTRVQVVDIDGGAIAGEVAGFGEAHAVALDPGGQFGYVSDGRAAQISIFDRRTFQVLAKIPVSSSPRALVFEPRTGMLFAFGSLPTPAPPGRNASPPARPDIDAPCTLYARGWPPPPAYQSLVSIIDPEKRTTVANVQVCGILGAAAADGDGRVYFTIGNFNAVGSLSASSLLELAQRRGSPELTRVHGYFAGDGSLQLDFKAWTSTGGIGPHFRVFRLGRECQDPRAIAVDAAHARLFAACSNMKFQALATDSGAALASLTIGPGVDAMAYDAGRGLIYTANGGGYGSVTVVRQHLTDSYAVIQNLPTMQQARTAAVDPSTGLLYLVTTLYGANLEHPPVNGIGTLKLNPIDGSFQVLVVGN
jgi:DNA-binding beta-propeller fold protein YncE